MNLDQIDSIDQVISILDKIITDSIKDNDPLGYFASLYQKVTIKVKEGIQENEFEDGARMEQLDIVFAKRYLKAYFDFKQQAAISLSWKKAMDLSECYWPIVLQHLLVGINAHISLDLGIAAAEISKAKNIDDLKNDFNKINEILSALVTEVEEDLTRIWPRLKFILKKTKKVDDFLVDFSMKIARDGAWKFAQSLHQQTEQTWTNMIAQRDLKVSKKAKIITNPGFLVNTILGVVRIGERGSVANKIEQLKK